MNPLFFFFLFLFFVSSFLPSFLFFLSFTLSSSQNDPDIIKQGMLQKRGDKVKNWTQRWFALKQNRMIYYEVLPSGELKVFFFLVNFFIFFLLK